jgi:hypothetical protein
METHMQLNNIKKNGLWAALQNPKKGKNKQSPMTKLLLQSELI